MNNFLYEDKVKLNVCNVIGYVVMYLEYLCFVKFIYFV